MQTGMTQCVCEHHVFVCLFVCQLCSLKKNTVSALCSMSSEESQEGRGMAFSVGPHTGALPHSPRAKHCAPRCCVCLCCLGAPPRQQVAHGHTRVVSHSLYLSLFFFCCSITTFFTIFCSSIMKARMMLQEGGWAKQGTQQSRGRW